jgi:hypothetical protein
MKVEVRNVIHKEGNKNGKSWAMDIASVIVQNDDGTEALGELILPKGHPTVAKGFYDANLKAMQSQGSVLFVVQQLNAVSKPSTVSKVG